MSHWQQMNREAMREGSFERYFGALVSLNAKSNPIDPLLSTNLKAGGKDPYLCFIWMPK
jgi:hypothetical protein